jgi:hypothetical protein
MAYLAPATLQLVFRGQYARFSGVRLFPEAVSLAQPHHAYRLDYISSMLAMALERS